MTTELCNKIYEIVYPLSPHKPDGSNKEQFEKIALLIDPYFLLREARKEGKEIQVMPINGETWLKAILDCPFNLPVENYRIKPPAPELGEYYQNINNKNIYILNGKGGLVNTKTGCSYSHCQEDAFNGDFDSFKKVNVEVKLKN